MNYTIRLARAEELGFLREVEFASGALFAEIGLYNVAKSDSLPLTVLQAQQQAGMVWVAADSSDCAVGFAAASEKDGTIYLEQISVHPAHGRRGIGKLLIETLCEWTAEKGMAAVTLSTFVDVAWNAPFYSRIGFRALVEEELSPSLKKSLDEESRAWFPLKRVVMRRELSAKK